MLGLRGGGVCQQDNQGRGQSRDEPEPSSCPLVHNPNARDLEKGWQGVPEH